ncbi:MAG: hypothetical protein ABSA97_12895 [Verrucomicrobiia bacterium]
MGNVSIVIRLGAVLWGLVVIVSFPMLYSSVSSRRSLLYGETIAQAIFCVVFWVLIGTIAPDLMATGENATFYKAVFYGVPWICFVRQLTRFAEILKE